MGERKTGLDILRVFSSLQVIMFHLYLNNGFGKKTSSISFVILSVLCKSSNFHFMLLSGYLAATSRFLLSKTFPLILATWFYSLVEFFNAVFFFKYYDFSKERFIMAFFPLAYCAFWYNLPFLLWQFLFSFISPTLQKLNKRYHLTICFIVLCAHILPWVGFYNGAGSSSQYSIWPFLCMALIASYVKFYYKGVSIYILFLWYFAVFFYNFLLHHNPGNFDFNWKILLLFRHATIMRFPSLLLSIPLFMIALSFNKQWKYHYIIRFLSESSISIYMFHYGESLRKYWEMAIKPSFDHLDTHWKGVISLTLKIYTGSALVECAREHIFNTLVFKRKYYIRFANSFNGFFMNMN